MALSPGQKRLYLGDYNDMGQEWQDDGSVIVTLNGGGSPGEHRLHVYDLWGPDEEVLVELEEPDSPPAYLVQRMKEAEE